METGSFLFLCACVRERDLKIQAVLYDAGLKRQSILFVWGVNWCVKIAIFTPGISMHMTGRVSHNV
jgi:hypothetical protein